MPHSSHKNKTFKQQKTERQINTVAQGGVVAGKGNLALALPGPDKGKDPRAYNYLSAENTHSIEKGINVQMHMEFYEFLLEEKFKSGFD